MNRDCPETVILARSGLSLFLLLMLLFITGAYGAESAEDSKRFYEKVVQIQPANANAHFDLGNVYLREKRYDDALTHYNKAGRLGLAALRMDSYYFNLAVCYVGLGRMDDAVRSLERCIEANPGNQEAKDLLAIYKDTDKSGVPGRIFSPDLTDSEESGQRGVPGRI